jgi:uncharacterized membrane protein
MVSPDNRIERVVEAVLSLGLLASAALLVAGLGRGQDPLLRLGVMLLIATPVVRVVVVTLGLLLERDWLFSAVSLWILAVLLWSLWLAFHPPA